MEVILLENISNLGHLGDKVNVKPGYGRNYLIPQNKAVAATAEKLAEFEQRRTELEQRAAVVLAEAQARAEKIEQIEIVVTQKAGEEGKLFGSVGTQDIANAVTEAGIPIEKHEVRLPEGVLRHTGEFDINLQLHSTVMTTLRLIIESE